MVNQFVTVNLCRKISTNDREEMYIIPFLDEIMEVVFNLSVDIIPGPDGFSGVFF